MLGDSVSGVDAEAHGRKAGTESSWMRAQCLQHGAALGGEFKNTVGVTELDPSVFLTQFQMLTHFDQGDFNDLGNASSLSLFGKFLKVF